MRTGGPKPQTQTLDRQNQPRTPGTRTNHAPVVFVVAPGPVARAELRASRFGLDSLMNVLLRVFPESPCCRSANTER